MSEIAKKALTPAPPPAAEEKELPDVEGGWWQWYDSVEGNGKGKWVMCYVSRKVNRWLWCVNGTYDRVLPGKWRRALTPDQEDALRAEVAELRRQLSPPLKEVE